VHTDQSTPGPAPPQQKFPPHQQNETSTKPDFRFNGFDMTSPQAADQIIARRLSALGHEARLHIFRFLVRAGHDGAIVGEIGAHTGLAPSTLAHHLSALVDAGLVTQERRGRETVNRVAFDTVTATLSYLTDACCTGVSGSEVAA
jgi:ArsR family transcriptional regulator, arsenate/arsenite/antimonite-responsive transcriptional repressor